MPGKEGHHAQILRIHYYRNQRVIVHIVLGSVFENDGKNDVLSFRFRFFKTENETTSFRLVVLF